LARDYGDAVRDQADIANVFIGDLCRRHNSLHRVVQLNRISHFGKNNTVPLANDNAEAVRAVRRSRRSGRTLPARSRLIGRSRRKQKRLISPSADAPAELTPRRETSPNPDPGFARRKYIMASQDRPKRVNSARNRRISA